MASNNELSLLSLPTETLVDIWKQNCLTHIDICYLAKVCSAFREISAANDVWESKYKQRYPQLYEKLGLDSKSNWLEKYQRRHLCGRNVFHLVAAMPARYYEKSILDLSPAFAHMCTDTESILAVIDELRELYRREPRHKNLTVHFWAKRALLNLQSKHLTVQINHFMAKPPEKQLVEEGALHAAQWCQPYIYVNYKQTQHAIAMFAREVVEWVRTKFPRHPIIGRPMDTIPTELLSSEWGDAECVHLISGINHVLFLKHGFCGESSHDVSLLTYCIDLDPREQNYMKKKPIIVAALYIAVARCLGVLCKYVADSDHAFLTWYDKDRQGSYQKNCLVDICHGILSTPMEPKQDKDTGNHHLYDQLASALVGRVTGLWSGGAQNMMRVGELAVLLHPTEERRLKLANFYISLNTKLEEIDLLLEPVLASRRIEFHGTANYLRHLAREGMAEMRRDGQFQYDVLTPIKPKHRSNPTVLYKVGMIMKHVRYSYMCVIRGWDEKCEASTEWVVQMGVDQLPKQDKQPFYHVLVADNSERYAAQENLAPAPEPSEIANESVGKYFSEFCHTHYKPNAVIRQRYPEDVTDTLESGDWQ